MWDRTLEHYELLNHIVSRCWADWPWCEVVCRVPAFIAMSSCFQIVSLSPGVTHTLHMITVQWCLCVCVEGSWYVYLCVCVCIYNLNFLLFHLLSQHLNLAWNVLARSLHLCLSFSLCLLPNHRCGWWTPLGALTPCLGVHLVSAVVLLTAVYTMATTHVHETVSPPLETNLLSTETSLPFSSPFTASS